MREKKMGIHDFRDAHSKELIMPIVRCFECLF